jgi:hypothetical protein
VVLYTNNPAAEASAVDPDNPVTGANTLVEVSATLGGKKPLSDALTSNFAEALGVVVPMPVWAKTLVEINRKRKIIRFILASILWLLDGFQSPLVLPELLYSIFHFQVLGYPFVCLILE